MDVMRRTARFAQLAEEIDHRCQAAGVQVDADAIDGILRPLGHSCPIWGSRNGGR